MGRVHRVDDLAALIAVTSGERIGAATWIDDGVGGSQILGWNSLTPGIGSGSDPREAAEHGAPIRGSEWLWLNATNDNLTALRVYQRCGSRGDAIDDRTVDHAPSPRPFSLLSDNGGIPIHSGTRSSLRRSWPRGELPPERREPAT